MNALNAATSQIDNGMQGEIRYVSHKAHYDKVYDKLLQF